MNIAKLTQMLIAASVMLIVCSLGLKATLREPTYLLRQRLLLVRSLFAMFIIMPVFTGVLVYAMALPPALEIALVALSVSPVPPVLPKKTLAAGGRRPYVLGLLLSAAMTSILCVPVAVELVEKIFDWPARMPFGSIARIVTTSIIVPLGVGLALRQVWPGIAERFPEPLSRIATLLLIVSLLPVLFTQGSAAVSLIGNGTLLVITVFVTFGFAAGTLLAGSDASDRTVLSLSTASRHPGVAVAIANTNFPNQKLVVPAVLLYLVVNALLSWLFLTWLRLKRRERSSGGRQSAA